MCDDGAVYSDPYLDGIRTCDDAGPTSRGPQDRDGAHGAHGTGWSRRQFLTAVGGGAAAAGVELGTGTAAAAGTALVGAGARRLAMHVHGSWSEGRGSWAAQFTQAAAAGIDVLYMTDHDSRATTYTYLTSLAGAVWVRSTTGQGAQSTLAAGAAGSLHLVSRAAPSGSPASGTLALQPQPMAKNRFRTSISGLRLEHRFGAVTLVGGALYEVLVELSYHPATPDRPAGDHSLVYRFGAPRAARFTEEGGLRGVVAIPAAEPGSTVVLVPEDDVAALWPDMLAIDNVSFGLAFTVSSPASDEPADVVVEDVAIRRSRNGAAQVVEDQRALLDVYSPRFPTVTGRATTEVGRVETHLNPFGVPQFFSDYALDTPKDHDAFYTDLVADVHGDGGVVSLNHPLGYNTTPLLSAADQAAKRRTTYAALAQRDVYGADLLEVGYTARGFCDLPTHLALWDTFSRNGRWLTANGANDDHGGKNWRSQSNGYYTGAWAADVADVTVTAALRSGRAYIAHLGKWGGGTLDLLVDGVAPMGSVLVSGASSHRLEVQATGLPDGSKVELVRGPVDFSGALDPGTAVARTIGAGEFAATGVKRLTVQTQTSSFWRVQVRLSTGAVVGVSNPVWILLDAPSRPIPAARRA